ncbi:MAG TPA: Na-translocating system protein MpsC family protein, partial [Candidatus Binatia bacterium]|nr:Na-translocating system protein MpsC family protein [Candidatus Binatia bacterium]
MRLSLTPHRHIVARYRPMLLNEVASPMKTKGEVEAAISEAMVGFEIDFMGRGPKEARSHIIDDLILVRLKGVLTPAEQQLAK